MKKGFTLAEVLITLGVIGIVAQMTIPTLVNNVRQAVLKSQLKEAYSILLAAGAAIKNENGGSYEGLCTSDGTTTNLAANDCIINAFRDKLKYVKECAAGSTQGVGNCWPTAQYRYNTTYDEMDYDAYNRKGLVLNNGMSFTGFYVDKTCNTMWAGYTVGICGGIHVDLNGFSPPNMLGKDVHQFVFTKDTILPFGAPSAYTVASGYQDCPGAKGFGCTAHLLNGEDLPNF